MPIGLPGVHRDGYLSAVEFRFERGSFDEPGPAMGWGRQKVPLLDGETPTGWQRVLVLADSGSGISLALDPTRYPAINCDLSVTLHRDPVTEWVGLDAATTITAGAGAMTSNSARPHRLDRDGDPDAARRLRAERPVRASATRRRACRPRRDRDRGTQVRRG